MNNPLDRDDPRLVKAREAVSASMMSLMENITSLELVVSEMLFDKAYRMGYEDCKEEIARLAGPVRDNKNVDQQVDPKKQAKISEVEKIAEENILAAIDATPGTLRTVDISSKIAALPFRPNITESMVWMILRRMEKQGKILQKADRWYSTKPKQRAHDYQVMTYMPDGSKYLGSDITR